jgi:RecJ-like exonuclease
MNADFSKETCCGCDGAGQRNGKQACVSCEGQGWVMVLRPPIQCPRCRGSSRGTTNSFCSTFDRCEICFGTGWVRTARHFTSTHV